MLTCKVSGCQRRVTKPLGASWQSVLRARCEMAPAVRGDCCYSRLWCVARRNLCFTFCIMYSCAKASGQDRFLQAPFYQHSWIHCPFGRISTVSSRPPAPEKFLRLCRNSWLGTFVFLAIALLLDDTSTALASQSVYFFLSRIWLQPAQRSARDIYKSFWAVHRKVPINSVSTAITPLREGHTWLPSLFMTVSYMLLLIDYWV